MSKLFELLNEFAKERKQKVELTLYPTGQAVVTTKVGDLIAGDEAQLIAKLSQFLLDQRRAA
jgi:hypothetical protein